MIVVMILCLPFDIVTFIIIRIIKGFYEMIRNYKWYQIMIGNVVLLSICIVGRAKNEIYYYNCEEIVKFFQPLSYKIMKAY